MTLLGDERRHRKDFLPAVTTGPSKPSNKGANAVWRDRSAWCCPTSAKLANAFAICSRKTIAEQIAGALQLGADTTPPFLESDSTRISELSDPSNLHPNAAMVTLLSKQRMASVRGGGIDEASLESDRPSAVAGVEHAVAHPAHVEYPGRALAVVA